MTSLADASEAGVTVGIFPAFWLRFFRRLFAVSLRISNKAWWAFALRSMTGDEADCVRCEWILITAWIHTLAIDTGLIQGAFTVPLASFGATLLKRISFIPWRTTALSPMVFRIAFCIDGTWVLQDTGIQALLLMALFVVRTFSI